MISLGIYEKAFPDKLTITEKMVNAELLGFNFLELSIDVSDQKIKRLAMSKKEKEQLCNYFISNDFRINTLCLSANRKYPIGHPNDNIANTGLEIIFKAIDLCSDLGIRVILLSGYDVFDLDSTYDTKEKFKKNLRLALDYASKKFVCLAIETMDTSFINTCFKANYYCELFESPYLGIYLDIGNISSAHFLEGTNVIDDLFVAKDKIMCVHFKDVLPNIVRNVPFGEGIVNFDQVVRILKQMNVYNYVAEFWHQEGEDWEKEIKGVKKFADSYLYKYYERR